MADPLSAPVEPLSVPSTPEDARRICVLIVEDEPRIASFLESGLQAEGFATRIARTGSEGITLGVAEQVDLVVLDVMLPQIDGFGVLAALRARRGDLPVLMLTARDDMASKVGGLEAGADDYLTKPFVLEEFLARVRALLRRQQRERRLVLGDLALDLRARTLRAGEETVELTGREFELLEYLMRRPGAHVGRRDLLAHVWGLAFDPQTTVLETTLNRLRRKLARAGSRWRIENVRGSGYVLISSER